MALNRVVLNRVSLKRMSVPGTGGGGGAAPVTPAAPNVAVQIFTEITEPAFNVMPNV